MTSLTVLGVGSRLYCDDGIGCAVAKALSQSNNDPAIRYLIGETDLDYMLSLICSPAVAVIDAVQLGGAPGSIYRIPFHDNLASQAGISMHNLHILSYLTEKYHDSGLLIGIEPYELSFNYGLSESMNSHFNIMVNQIDNLLHSFYQSLNNG